MNKSLLEDDKGVSIVVQYTLVLGIAIGLIITLIAGLGSVADQRTDAVIEQEKDRVAVEMQSAVTTTEANYQYAQANTGTTSLSTTPSAETTVRLPNRIENSNYHITLSGDTTDQPTLRVISTEMTVEKDLQLEEQREIEDSAVSGGEVTIVLSDGQLSIE